MRRLKGVHNLDNNQKDLKKIAEKDCLIVKEVVLSFYREILAKSNINYIVKVYDQEGDRRSIEELLK